MTTMYYDSKFKSNESSDSLRLFAKSCKFLYTTEKLHLV